jgi:hypothetical protein
MYHYEVDNVVFFHKRDLLKYMGGKIDRDVDIHLGKDRMTLESGIKKAIDARYWTIFYTPDDISIRIYQSYNELRWKIELNTFVLRHVSKQVWLDKQGLHMDRVLVETSDRSVLEEAMRFLM